jgi:anaerobic ribonucleoside-triphosphate reductase activating protein
MPAICCGQGTMARRSGQAAGDRRDERRRTLDPDRTRLGGGRTRRANRRRMTLPATTPQSSSKGSMDSMIKHDEGRQSETLRLGHQLWALRPTLHNGPGWRIPLWVQGCSLRCTTTCLNPQFLEQGGGTSYDVEEIVAHLDRVLARASERIEGITVLGGEPTDQPLAVAALFEAARARGLSTMLYTGATLEELRARRSSAIDGLLAAADLLVDGPFLPREFDRTLIWRGSRNQRILRLSDRYGTDDIEIALAEQGRGFSILLSPDGGISVSGLQTRRGARLIEEQLR